MTMAALRKESVYLETHSGRGNVSCQSWWKTDRHGTEAVAESFTT